MQPYGHSDLGHFQDTSHDDDGYNSRRKNGSEANDTVPGRHYTQTECNKQGDITEKHKIIYWVVLALGRLV